MKKADLVYWLKNFYFSILVAVIVFFLSAYFLLPKIGQIKQINKDIADQKERIAKLSSKLADLQSLSEADLYNHSSLLLEALPPQKDFYKMMTITKQIFTESSATLKSFTFSPGKISSDSARLSQDSSTANQLSMKILFVTSYESFSKLLDGFTKSLPLMEVDSINFSTILATQSGSLPDLEGTISVKSYFSALPKMLGQVDSPLPKISNQGKSLIEELTSYNQYKAEEAGIGEAIVGKENPFP